MSRQLSAFEQAAYGQRPSSSPQTVPSVVPDLDSPTQQVSRKFLYQSYFDTTLLGDAILRQPQNEPIVDSKEETIPGYALGLSPFSETPIAVEFRVGNQKSSSGPLILKPGAIIRPYGLPPGVKQGSFSGFRWGLPFGWLGGGVATLHVFSTPDSVETWTENREVIFHRARYRIAPGAVTSPLPYNWPTRFPWTRALFGGAAPVNQSGAPAIVVEPTRFMMVLRLATLAAAATMRFNWQATQDFGLDSAGAAILTEAPWAEYAWPIYAATGIVGVTSYPVGEFSGAVARLGADDGGMQLTSADASLLGAYVDIVRLGRL